MSNNVWITDRLPTEADAVRGKVLTIWNGELVCWPWKHVSIGSPWQTLPEPYVKPKRWTVIGDEINNTIALAEFGEWRFELCALTPKHYNAAQRICDIYNEVLP